MTHAATSGVARLLVAVLILAAVVFLGASGAAGDDAPAFVNSVGMKLVRIRKGEFTMGSEEFPSEKPPRSARVTRDFDLAAHLVTRAQFRSFVDATGYRTDAEKGGGAEGFDRSRPGMTGKAGHHWKNPGFEQQDDHPVVCVSWNDAVAFCEWLSRKEGKRYRPPTDRELEYAIRAGTRTHWSCGDTPESLKGYANCADLALVRAGPFDATKLAAMNRGLSPISSGIATWDDGFAFTSPVSALKPNPWGLYDMHGNAWQWCLDLMKSNRPTKDPQVESEDVRALAQGVGNRKIRGGTWWLGPGRCRSANWANRVQSGSFAYIGFRVACDLE
jgi:sulfatase modifying factor 1